MFGRSHMISNMPTCTKHVKTCCDRNIMKLSSQEGLVVLQSCGSLIAFSYSRNYSHISMAIRNLKCKKNLYLERYTEEIMKIVDHSLMKSKI